MESEKRMEVRILNELLKTSLGQSVDAEYLYQQ